MRYEAEIDGRPAKIEFSESGDRVTATIDGRSYEVEVARPEEGVYLLFHGDKVFEARVWDAEADSLKVQLRDQTFSAKIIDLKQRRSGADQSHEGQQHLVAPMPGKVVRVLHRVGDQVEAGQGVVVVEAMKMQNEVKSSKAGRVIEVRVTEGATVNAGQLLAIVE
ncbi:MAG TPA: biotin/lipoyl-containing protein [Blastocatellia bacterium]|nr:biotin/lipoyl-containing protein [Blastocatellia bacterium]